MALKLSPQEKKDLDKYSKFLAFKTAQIIVQSRLGEKVYTQCTPKTSQNDWFNLAVPDLPDVLTEAKKVINGEILTTRLPLCVEISLRTVEGDQMVLESWCLSVLPERCDPIKRIAHSVYNHMGILLKSLVSVTRVTPAYKLSRRQGPDSYVICYRIYMGEPQLHTLGEGYKQVRIGQICTPLGTLQLGVSYRTKMTISPTHPERGHSIMVKSDHFDTNLSPRHLRYKQNEDKVSLSGPIKVGAFADEKLRNLKPQVIIPDIPFGNLLPAKKSADLKSSEKELLKPSDDETEDGNGNSPITDSGTSDITMVSTNDDFIMVELKTPFANPNSNTELGQFYREWQTAPPLKTFTEVPTIAEQVQDLSKQLETYEIDMHKYEDVLQSICESPNNN